MSCMRAVNFVSPSLALAGGNEIAGLRYDHEYAMQYYRTRRCVSNKGVTYWHAVLINIATEEEFDIFVLNNEQFCLILCLYIWIFV